MQKEVVDGSTVYSELFTDGPYTWNFLVRPGGSISLYATEPGVHAHRVAYDTLDRLQPNLTARRVLVRLAEMAEGINLLLATEAELTATLKGDSPDGLNE